MNLLLAALLGTSVVHGYIHGLQDTAAIADDNKPWDYLLFVQRWPQSVCDSMKQSECEIPSNISDWVVHGLWPNYNDGKWPQFCDKDDKFDVSKVEQLRTKLHQTWPNLERGKTEESLWAHEWEKHGTCAKTLPALGDEQKYFWQTLNLLNTYHVGKALSKNNIVPSNTKSYTKAQIEQALRDNLGQGKDLFDLACIRGQLPHSSSVAIENSGHRGKGKAQLVEARTCLDKQLSLISCPKSASKAAGALHQRVKRALFDVVSWFGIHNLPVAMANEKSRGLADDDQCPDEIYIPVLSN